MIPENFLIEAADLVTVIGDCLVWTDRLSHSGYGLYRSNKGPVVHRLVYTSFMGEIPTKYVINHTCHHRACVLLTHLEAVTEQENSRQVCPPDGCYACGRREPVCRRGKGGKFCYWCWGRMPGLASKHFPIEYQWAIQLYGEALSHLRAIRHES